MPDGTLNPCCRSIGVSRIGPPLQGGEHRREMCGGRAIEAFEPVLRTRRGRADRAPAPRRSRAVRPAPRPISRASGESSAARSAAARSSVSGPGPSPELDAAPALGRSQREIGMAEGVAKAGGEAVECIVELVAGDRRQDHAIGVTTSGGMVPFSTQYPPLSCDSGVECRIVGPRTSRTSVSSVRVCLLLMACFPAPIERSCESEAIFGRQPVLAALGSDVANEVRSLEVGCREPKTHFHRY